MRAFSGPDSLWHAVQSDDYPAPEITRNVNQNCDLYIFRQGDDEEAMKASKLLMGALDRMKEHHRETRTRHVQAGFTEVERRGNVLATDGHGHLTGFNHQYGTQLVAQYGEKTEEVVKYESGTDQILWQARDLTQLPQRVCMVRRADAVPVARTVDLFPDSWKYQGDPEKGVDPVWLKKFNEALAKLKELPEYEAPLLIPVPVPPPPALKKREPKSRPKGSTRNPKTVGEMMRGKETKGSGGSSNSTR